MAVYEASSEPTVVDVVPDSALVNHDDSNDDNLSHEDDENQEGRKKTRRSRRGGYRRKRQQQKKVAALMAASAAERARKLLEAVYDNSSQTSTTEEESSSSSGESSEHKSPQRVVARKKGSVSKQLQQLLNQQKYYQHAQQSYYNQGQPLHPSSRMYSYPPYGYPAPQQRKSKRYPPSWDLTKPSHQAQFLAMDCEMVGVGVGGGHSALARVTLIDFHGNVVMDELVKPQWEVTDYRTFVSGITKEMLDNATMDFATARKLVLRHLKGKVLVGHALRNDLGVLGITHPWYMIRDTAKYDPYMKLRMDGCLWPRSLKDLCLEKLGRDVQVYGRPHCPKEDAMAALDLYRLVSHQWEKSIEYQRNTGWTMPPLPM